MVNRLLKRVIPVTALVIGLTLSGCNMDIDISGNDGVTLAELDMSGQAPTELVVAGPDKVIVLDGETLDITADGDVDAVAALRFELDNETLMIGRKDGDWSASGSTIVTVTMPSPKSLTIGGSGNIEAQSLAKKASVNIGGSGKVAVALLDSTSLDVNIGGSGEMSGRGTLAKLDVTIGGNGDIKFADVQVDDAEITIGGSGNVAFASDGTVEATIGGSGAINVTGDAKCELNSFGSGALNCQPRAGTAK